MKRKVDFTHTDFLGQIVGKGGRKKADERWVSPRAKSVREVAVNQSVMT